MDLDLKLHQPSPNPAYANPYYHPTQAHIAYFKFNLTQLSLVCQLQPT